MKRKNTCIRLCFYISGLILFSFGISVTIYANIGVSSWDAVSVGLNKLYGCSIGTWMNLISICQIIAGGILCKERIRFETFLTSLGLGFLVDGFNLMLCHITCNLFGSDIRNRYATDCYWLWYLSLCRLAADSY